MDPFTILLLLGGQAIISAISNLFLDQAKTEAEESRDTILGDLDAALVIEKEKLEQEYDVTKKRLEETRDTVLGSQRQGFFLRGDVGGQDTAAAQVITTTENRAQSDLDLLATKYELGIETLESQTQLARDELDWQFKTYMSGITTQQIGILGDTLSMGLGALGGLDLPGIFGTGSASLRNPFQAGGTLLTPMDDTPILAGWNPITGYPV